MRITIKSLFITFLLITAYANIQAQRGGGGMSMEERAKQQTATMTDSLVLSKAQAAKVGEINLKYAKKMSEMRSGDGGGDWTAMREKMTVLRQEQDKELKTVLTTGQYDKWKKIQESQRGNRGGRRGNRNGQTKEKNG
jgi:periplasmic protein CpxP/Spy